MIAATNPALHWQVVDFDSSLVRNPGGICRRFLELLRPITFSQNQMWPNPNKSRRSSGDYRSSVLGYLNGGLTGRMMPGARPRWTGAGASCQNCLPALFKNLSLRQRVSLVRLPINARPAQALPKSLGLWAPTRKAPVELHLWI